MAGNTSRPGASPLLRGIAVLDCFDADHLELSVTEIARRTGLATSTAARLAAQLVDAGMLERGPDKRLRIGTKVWEMGLRADVGLVLRERALPFMVELYEGTGENIHLAIRAGREALYVDRLMSSRSVPTVSRMGGRLPLHTTGVGKVLLAYESDEFIEDYVRGVLARPTAYSITSPGRLYDDVRAVRDRGYSLTSQEQTLGNVSIAMPIHGSRRRVVAALGIVMHTARADVPRQVGALRRATEGIAKSLGNENPLSGI
ncbi:IclR family transcriptional regulator [Spelaeicoccus albus]|uniref:DNA-binding IclR family transcriptional regulator n=1 Tax=Spelaeicoccus albus TaxID=1280376 RepID=A0A7Z0ABR6_9MICO|nr:IclR family transcriptional regulator [Spelaeicoccus albus]NYI66748.1 DNA-binding IclR family transcriptional regulator [Spelaeicoccus albus]